MRKVMMLAAMLAMVMVAAAPAMAQSSATGGDVQIQNQQCEQVITQYANADQSNTGGGLAAAIAQDLGIDQSAVNSCLQAGGDIGIGGDTVVDGEVPDGDVPDGDVPDGDTPDGEVVGESDPGVAGAASGGAAAASGGVLPDTGGASLIALGAGALLVGGGLLARRIVR